MGETLVTFEIHGPPASYFEAKTGFASDAAPTVAVQNVWETLPAHLDRNQWQVELVPDHMPQSMPFHDERTGVIWSPDNKLSQAIWHGADSECFRGALSEDWIETLRADPAYRHAFEQVNGHSGYDFLHVVAGAQACYDETGKLIESGPHAGTWDFASPSVDGQSHQHLTLDVVPDWHADNYTAFHTAPDENADRHCGVGLHGVDHPMEGSNTGAGQSGNEHGDGGSHGGEGDHGV